MRKRLFFLSFLLSCFVLAETNVKLCGEVATRWRWDSREIYPNNKFELVKLRPKIVADLDSNFSAKIAVELSTGKADLKDAEVKWTFGRPFSLALGKRRKPFGLENIYGTWSAPGVELTEVTDLFDDAGFLNRDLGIWACGKFFSEPYQIEYDFGLYNGHGGLARTSEKQVVGRVVYSPLKILDFTASLGAGMDTLGLEWRNAWDIGTMFKWRKLEIAGEYASGKDIYTKNDIEGYQFWTRYKIGKFRPFVQFEKAITEIASSEYFERKQRTHIGLMFEPIKAIRLRAQASYVDDSDDSPHTEIFIQAHARF